MKMKFSAGAKFETCDVNRNSDCDLRSSVALLSDRLYESPTFSGIVYLLPRLTFFEKCVNVQGL